VDLEVPEGQQEMIPIEDEQTTAVAIAPNETLVL
jgi:hypothetical protein